MLRDAIKKIFWTLIYFSGINFIYNKAFPIRLVLIGGHSVSSKENKKELSNELYQELSIDKEFLEAQIRYLLKGGYKFLNFEQVNKLLEENKKLPQKTAIMYFDDGWRDNYLNAYPVFNKYNLPFVIFVSTDLIDQKRLIPSLEKRVRGTQVQERMFLNWDEARKMSNLAEIGSHGATHRDFPGLSNGELKEELWASIKRIKEEIGKAPVALSFPHGRYNQEIKRLVAETGFKFAVTTKRGWADLRDKLELKKITIYPEDSMLIFKLKLGIFYKIKNLLK